MRGISAKEKKELVALVKGQCCNYMGDACILDECYCPQLGRINVYNQCVEAGDESAGLLVCRWFADAVLPLSRDLEGKFKACTDWKKCAECGRQYRPVSNRSKYCPECAVAVRNKQSRERMRQQRISVTH